VLVKTDRVVSWSAELDAHLGDILVAEQLDASRARLREAGTEIFGSWPNSWTPRARWACPHLYALSAGSG
jgi:hypothetical protein